MIRYGVNRRYSRWRIFIQICDHEQQLLCTFWYFYAFCLCQGKKN